MSIVLNLFESLDALKEKMFTHTCILIFTNDIMSDDDDDDNDDDDDDADDDDNAYRPIGMMVCR